MEQRCGLHWDSSALQFAAKYLVLVLRVFELGVDLSGTENISESEINDFCDYFDDRDILREVSDGIDVDINSLLFSFIPVLLLRVLLLGIGNKLGRILAIRVRIKH